MENSIIKVQPGRLARIQPPANPDAYLTAMWLMFCRAPAKANPNLDGSYWLGEVGEDSPKRWERLTPYSLAQAQ